MTRGRTVPVSIDVRVDAREAEDVPEHVNTAGFQLFCDRADTTGVVGKGDALGVAAGAGWGRDGEVASGDDALSAARPPLGELEPMTAATRADCA